MLRRAIITFLRAGQRYVLVDSLGNLIKVNIRAEQTEYSQHLQGQIIFLNEDLPHVPFYSRNKYLRQEAKMFAYKITDYYQQKTEKKALALLIKENYQFN